MNTIKLRVVCRNIAALVAERPHWRSAIEEAGFRCLGQGLTRTGYSHPDYPGVAFKVEETLYDSSTRRERSVWRKYRHTGLLAAQYAIAVVVADNGWRIVVGAYEFVPKLAQDVDNGDLRGPTTTKAGILLRSSGISLSDIHGHNVGVREDGSLCVIDYA